MIHPILSILGTKHIDPDTGLIYFKYDFGYEFGIIFPGEGKKLIAGGSTRQTLPTDRASSVPPLRQTYLTSGDLRIPVRHERTVNAANGCASETELSQTNSSPNKRWSLPIQIDIDSLHSPISGRPQSVATGQSSSSTSRGLQAGDDFGETDRFRCFTV